ncbi:uncharacterized protein LOC129723253 isoform X2 [Wyeomyia smithii]|nr:uncharacterized protein LOC129723253 isoform X2 [Wyeomyia smithii]
MVKIVFLLLLIIVQYSSGHPPRVKRQFSLNLGATHQEGEGTDVTAEAIARLWRSRSGATEVQGSAAYNQHFGGFEGND